MKIKRTKRVVINPNNPKNASIINSLNEPKINACEPFTLVDKYTSEKKEYLFTHNLYRINKALPKEPSRIYYQVGNPQLLGKGSCGSVQTVEGVWKLSDLQPIYKTKADPTKVRAIKVNELSLNESKAERQIDGFKSEQQIGKWVPHMGFKYPPFVVGDSIVLLMRKQPGETLESIINQLLFDAEHLSVREKLHITIDLLKQVHQQISGVKLPKNKFPRNAYICHRDLKPANILYDKMVKIIDYGFAVYNFSEPEIGTRTGTALWMDPFRYNGNGPDISDKAYDLGSIARIIAEFWGDTSRNEVNTTSELRQYNQENRTTNLCEGISELGVDEKQLLQQTIKKMTSLDLEDRLSREDALAFFEKMFVQRNRFLKEKINVRLRDLSESLIFEILKSPHAAKLISRFKNEPKEFPGLLNKIKSKIHRLDETTLRALKEGGLDFTQLKITLADLQVRVFTESQLNRLKDFSISPEFTLKNCATADVIILKKYGFSSHLKPDVYTPDQIPLLVGLGATLETDLLKNWFNTSQGNKARWAAICRALYQATENPDEVLGEIPKTNTFESLFYWHFLKKNDLEVDEGTIIRLIQRHLEVVSEQEVIKKSYIRLYIANNALNNTPVMIALFNSDLWSTSSEELILAREEHYKQIGMQLAKFKRLMERINNLKPRSNLEHANRMMIWVKADFEKRKNCDGYTWEEAFMETEILDARLRIIEKMGVISDFSPLECPDLDTSDSDIAEEAETSNLAKVEAKLNAQLVKQVNSQLIPFTDVIGAQRVASLQAELDDLLKNADVDILKDKLNHVTNYLSLLEKIRKTRLSINEIDNTLLTNSSLELGLTERISSLTVSNASSLYNGLDSYLKHYAFIHEKLVTLQKIIPNDGTELNKKRESIYKSMMRHLPPLANAISLYNDFLLGENQFKSQFGQHDSVLGFVYDIFSERLHTTPKRPDLLLLNIFTMNKLYHRVNKESLQQMNLGLERVALRKEHPSHGFQLAKLRALVWNYFNSDPTSLAYNYKELTRFVHELKPQPHGQTRNGFLTTQAVSSGSVKNPFNLNV